MTAPEALLDLLNPAPERRDEALQLLDSELSPHGPKISAFLWNPPRPAVLATRARRVAKLAEKLRANAAELHDWMQAQWSSQFPALRDFEYPELTGAREALPLLEEEALRLAEVASALPSTGAPIRYKVRHMSVKGLLSVFERFHVSDYAPGHLRWKAERNRFLHAALDTLGLGCDRRDLERHLDWIARQAKTVKTAP